MRNQISKETIQNIKFAVTAAKEKMGGQGQKLALAAFSVLFGFILMAILAPVAYRLPGVFQTILSIIPFALLILGVGIAIRLLFQFARDEKDATIPEQQTRGTIARGAIIAALDEVEKAALIKKDVRVYDDCVSGKFENMPVVVVSSGRFIYGVIRVHFPFKTMVILSSAQSVWPFGLPFDKKLTPINIPLELGAEGWAPDGLENRDLAQEIIFHLTPALKTAHIGGDLPFMVAMERNLILAWPYDKLNNGNGDSNVDIGSCTLITYEFAKSIANMQL